MWRACNLRLSILSVNISSISFVNIYGANLLYQVKYLGTCPVTSDSGEEVTANAIKAILATAKRLEKKLARVEVLIA